ncbi:hypothetical protein F5883DRAFT_142732 [Diaporthe sp. PMI_573]|nr:hypothetical protein F5883DRAFT_142732 [Diaporthaceae sp. PMI_573]
MVKQMQRIQKYPLFFKDLRKHSSDAIIKQDLEVGIVAVENFLLTANEAVDRSLLDEISEDLGDHVDNWKDRYAECFGSLLLHGSHTVITENTDQGNEYEIYLFEVLLLFFTEVPPSKTKNTKNKTYSRASMHDKNNKLRLTECIDMYIIF